MTVLIDPWGSNLIEDYEKLVAEFGLDPFSPNDLPQPNRLMRRRLVFASRDLAQIAKAIKEKKKFYVLTGVQPSGEKIHLGTKAVIENVKYFQEHGALTYVVIADLESAATRETPLKEARERALNFHIPAYLTLGLDPKKTIFYFQSENKQMMNLVFKFSKKVTHNEFRAIYGSPDPNKIVSSLAVAADILFPQLKEPMPGIIPVGADQDPHIRLTRDIARRVKSRWKFFTPSSIYNKFMPALDGSFKMSKSQPESCIELPEDMASVERKIRRAVTGGRKTLEEHRRLGAEVEKCMVFELLKQHLIEDDKKLDKIYHEYKSGKMTSSEIKEIAIEEMRKFMKSFEDGIKKNRKKVDKLQFVH